MFSYRTDAEQWRIFSALTTLSGTTPTEVFTGTVVDYISTNKHLLNSAYAEIQKEMPRVPDVEEDETPDAETVAAFEARYGTTPNAETAAAIEELESGGGEETTIEEIMAELNAGN
jgi:hypothetical protein